MSSILLSIFFLALAPFIYHLASQYRGTWAAIETLTQICVVGLVTLLFIPESIELAGFNVIAPALVGLFLPTLLERLWKRRAAHVHHLSVWLVVVGLAVHGMMDGVGLALPGHSHGHAHGGEFLSLGILLHRLPDGLLIWSLFYPKRGSRFSSLLLALLGMSTIIGFYLAEVLVSWNNETLLAYFQAFMAGSLLHIVFDRHDDLDTDSHGDCCHHHHH